MKYVDELKSEDLPVNSTIDSTSDRGVLVMYNYAQLWPLML